MKTWHPTPTDGIGMPLPIAPSEQDASAKRDWHHHFHPRRSPVLLGTDGMAVRNARVQLVDYDTHHSDYHGHYEGPPLPDTTAEKFGLVVLASAGYIPSEAIDFSKGEPRRVGLNVEQRKQMWKKGILKVGSIGMVHTFLTEYTMAQDLTNVDDVIVDEFLNTADQERKYKLAGHLLNLAVLQATEPIIPLYKRAWRDRLIDHTVTAKAQRFVRAQINVRKRRTLLANQLHEKLSSVA